MNICELLLGNFLQSIATFFESAIELFIPTGLYLPACHLQVELYKQVPVKKGMIYILNS